MSARRAALAFLLIAACAERAPVRSSQSSDAGTAETARSLGVEESPILVEVTEASGIDFLHATGETKTASGTPSRYLPETMGPGVLLFDGDGDGDLDILFVNSGPFLTEAKPTELPRSKYYENKGGMKFTDASKSSGLDLAFYGMGGAAADYDGDGDLDLVLTSYGGVKVLQNDGHGKFTDVTRESGI